MWWALNIHFICLPWFISTSCVPTGWQLGNNKLTNHESQDIKKGTGVIQWLQGPVWCGLTHSLVRTETDYTGAAKLPSPDPHTLTPSMHPQWAKPHGNTGIYYLVYKHFSTRSITGDEPCDVRPPYQAASPGGRPVNMTACWQTVGGGFSFHSFCKRHVERIAACLI